MARIIWTEKTLKDLKEIKKFIQQDSNYYAINLVSKIREKVKTIKLLPFGARIIPEINNPNYREVFQWSYRIMFKVEDEIIYILSVFHSARNLTDVASIIR
jgi:plasmid stabilization system protein ParE